MFGQNPIRENETKQDGRTLALQEVFYTLQGEGPYSGRPAVFVRLAGCNLACTFCDTEFESNIDNRVAVEAIADQVKECPVHDFVVLTGGEPLRQNIVPLIIALTCVGVKLVQIETAGTLWVPELEHLIEDGEVELVCSPKTPQIHPMVARWCMHYKYVIEAGRTNAKDGLPSYGTQQASRNLPKPLFRPWLHPAIAAQLVNTNEWPTIWVSPCDSHDPLINPVNVAEAVRVAMKHGYRLSLQTHKIVNLP